MTPVGATAAEARIKLLLMPFLGRPKAW